MYQVNGIDLSGSQYQELKKLVSLASDEEREHLFNKALYPNGEEGDCDPNVLSCYQSLKELNLIEGVSGYGAFVFYGKLTQAGIDFIKDYEEQEKRKRREIWNNRAFQFALSIVTLVLSTAAGWFAGHF